MIRHVVLIGLPGSGKTTVGKLVADALKAPFMDIDATVTRKEGRPISMIFAEKGEGVFREMERVEMEAALGGAPAIIAPGGGWAAQPGALSSVQQRGLVVYLKTRAETAASRAAPQGNRPVLMGEDPALQMRQLLKEREPFYVLADATVETDRKAPAKVVEEIVRLARARAGW
ncbi:MAG TPA: shikimate kinase [Gemmatimonadales bacterium]|nr:shikimate kinase [Gemmatimonadales bacterium]